MFFFSQYSKRFSVETYDLSRNMMIIRQRVNDGCKSSYIVFIFVRVDNVTLRNRVRFQFTASVVYAYTNMCILVE